MQRRHFWPDQLIFRKGILSVVLGIANGSADAFGSDDTHGGNTDTNRLTFIMMEASGLALMKAGADISEYNAAVYRGNAHINRGNTGTY